MKTLITLALLASMAVPAYADNPTWYILESHDASCHVASQFTPLTITPYVWMDALQQTNRFLKSTTRRIGDRGYEVSVESNGHVRIMFVSNLELCEFLLNGMIQEGVVKVR